jgi:hypothetical protein
MAPAVPPACPRCAGSIPASGNRASSPDAVTSRANWSSSGLAERRPVSSSGPAKPWKQSPVHLRRRGWVDPSAPAIVVAWPVPRLRRGGRQPPRRAFLPAARGSREWLLREGDDPSVHAWGQPCPNSPCPPRRGRRWSLNERSNPGLSVSRRRRAIRSRTSDGERERLMPDRRARACALDGRGAIC